jgi:hypothetical protein
MRRLALFSIAVFFITGLSRSLARPMDDSKEKPSGEVGRLPAKWAEYVTVKDLTDEIGESASRMGQNLKKVSDFDKFLKNIKTEGHLSAILAALVQEHPEAGTWQSVAAEIQSQGLAIAKAAESKGGKNFRTAADAHKKIGELMKKGESGDKVSSTNGREGSPNWASLGALADVMKRVEPSYKYIRGKMSNESVFSKEAEMIRHNSAMLYILGEIAPAFRPSEKDMVGLSAPMNAASIAMIEAAKSGDFSKASEANTAINTACNECHKAKRFQKKGADFDF